MLFAVKRSLDLTVSDINKALNKAQGLEREILLNALHSNKTSYQWQLAATIYNKIELQCNCG